MADFATGVLKAFDIWSLINGQYPFGYLVLLWLAVWVSIRLVRLVNDTFR